MSGMLLFACTQARASEPPVICADDGTEVTVTAKFWYVNDFEGGQEAAEAVTKAFVDKTNEVMKNSKVSIKYQQWGTVQQVCFVRFKFWGFLKV